MRHHIDMKYGVLVFSYSDLGIFSQHLQKRGHISINLGDNIQTLAVRRLYRQLGIGEDSIVPVDRDALSSYDGEPLALIMNACFFERSFPVPEQIVPVFVGFQCKEPIIAGNLDYFRKHQPIGCRDRDTAALFARYGIEAFVSGCLTLTLRQRKAGRRRTKVLVVYGSGAGALPTEVLRYLPEEMFTHLEFLSQRQIVHAHPLSAADMQAAEDYASYLLGYYKRNAALVITPLHHATTPCIAAGIPVVLCRTADDPRFSYLRELLPLYLPADFHRIDWNPPPVDIGSRRDRLVVTTKEALERATRRLFHSIESL